MKYLNFPKNNMNAGVIYLSERIDERELISLFYNYTEPVSTSQLNINTPLTSGGESESANTTLVSRVKSAIGFARQQSIQKVWLEIKKLWTD